jgi:hypothetical protein
MALVGLGVGARKTDKGLTTSCPMFRLEARRLNHLGSTIRAASGEQTVTIERLVPKVASIRAADVPLARRTG